MLSPLVFRVLRCRLALVPLFFAIGVRQLLLSTVFPPAPVPLSPLPVGETVCNSRRWITMSIGLPSVVGAGDLFPSPKYVMRSFFRTGLGFFGKTCSRLLGSAFLIGVDVMSSLFRAPFPSSVIEILIYSDSSSVLISTSSE